MDDLRPVRRGVGTPGLAIDEPDRALPGPLRGGHADWMRETRKVFHNTLPAAVLEADPTQHGGRRVVFLSGNERSANGEIATLIERLGFAAIDLGKVSEGGRLQQFGGPLVALDLARHGSPTRRSQ